MIATALHGRQWSTPLAALCLAIITGLSVIATSQDALGLLLISIVLLAAVAVAVINPTMLFYAYCAAIPLSDFLAAGPVGTVGRIAGVVFFVGYLVRTPNSLRSSAIPVTGYLFVIWALLTSLWAIDTESSFDTWLSLLQLFAISVLVASIVAINPGVVQKALWSYTIPATLTAGAAVLSSLQGFSSRASAFGDQSPAVFAGVILPATIFLMWEVQSRDSSRALRLIALVALVTCVVAVGLSGTRSAWLGIVVATAVMLLLQRDPRQVVAVAGVAFAIVLLVSTVPGSADFLTERAVSSLSSGGSGRTDIWAVGLGIFASAPVVGVGFGNFPIAFTADAIGQVAGASVGGPGRASHNVLLGAFAEMGVVGGLLLIGFFASSLLQSRGDWIGNLIRAVLIGILVQSFFTDILLRKQLWLFLAIAFGLALAQQVDLAPAARRAPRLWPARFRS